MVTAAPRQSRWYGENHQYLMALIMQVQTLLKQRLTTDSQATATSLIPPEFPADLPPPALTQICDRLQLSEFARNVLLLCAGAALMREFGQLCGALQGSDQPTSPTFGIALATFAGGDWQAITPNSPLRRWHLVEVLPGAEITHSPLRLDERILHELMGVEVSDERLHGTVTPLHQPAIDRLPSSYQALADRIQQTGGWQSGHTTPVVQLCGPDIATKRAIAASSAAQAGLSLHLITADALPTELSQTNLWQTLCERESLLTDSALLLECDAVPLSSSSEGYLANLHSVIARVIETCDRPLLISSREPRLQRQRPLISLDVTAPAPAEQRQLWHRYLGDRAAELNGQINRLATYFNLGPPAIQRACITLDSRSDSVDELSHQLWQACLAQARPRLGELAQHISTAAAWDDLVLPDKERQVLQTLVAQVRQRATVYEQWGFAAKNQRGLGISALFAGASGTGKTLAAEVIAQELHLDLYRIDLSATISKYIGETEKNLRQIFDAAETGGAVLLFDEADALFGKRSEVSDARDRYANMEVAYLLQRIEAYRGLAILTSNLKDSIDQAFLRRIRFIVSFPFPDASQRERIWQRSFPAATPTQDLNYKKLAKLNVAGGNIRNIALNAAFLAAEAGESVGMPHILQAAKSEYIKLERPLPEREVKGWVPIIVSEAK